MYKCKGFTLIELLVVIAIIGILSGVVLAAVGKTRMAARDTRRIADIRQLESALDMYFNDKGYYPPVNPDAATGACSANVDCYDTRGWVWSYKPNEWQNKLGSHLSQYIQRMPVDPINAGIIPDFAGGFSYLYGNVGRYTYPAQYDIFALFETPNHPLSCKYDLDRYGRGFGANGGLGTGLCPEAGGSYLSNMYFQSNLE